MASLTPLKTSLDVWSEKYLFPYGRPTSSSSHKADKQKYNTSLPTRFFWPCLFVYQYNKLILPSSEILWGIWRGSLVDNGNQAWPASTGTQTYQRLKAGTGVPRVLQYFRSVRAHSPVSSHDTWQNWRQKRGICAPGNKAPGQMWTKEIKAGWMRWAQVEEGPQNRANKKAGVNIAELSLLVLHFSDQPQRKPQDLKGLEQVLH